jgi:hypothetical protein
MVNVAETVSLSAIPGAAAKAVTVILAPSPDRGMGVKNVIELALGALPLVVKETIAPGTGGVMLTDRSVWNVPPSGLIRGGAARGMIGAQAARHATRRHAGIGMWECAARNEVLSPR